MSPSEPLEGEGEKEPSLPVSHYQSTQVCSPQIEMRASTLVYVDEQNNPPFHAMIASTKNQRPS
jgi:hypothetical protein